MKVHITKFQNESGNYFDTSIPVDFSPAETFLYNLQIWKLDTSSIPNFPIEMYYWGLEWVYESGVYKIRIYYADFFGLRQTYYLLDTIDILYSDFKWNDDNTSRTFKINLKKDIPGGGFDICGSIMFKVVGNSNVLNSRHVCEIHPLDSTPKIDHITISKLPKDFINDLSEQFFDTDKFVYSAGIFQLKLLYGESSELSEQNFNLKEFFSDSAENDIYRIIITDGNNIIRNGFIDFDSLEVYEKTTSRGEVSFDVYSADKMLLDLMVDFNKINGIYSLRYAPDKIYWNQFITQCGNIFNLNIIDNTNIENEYLSVHGHKPYLETPHLEYDPDKGATVFKGIFGYCLSQKTISAIDFFLELLKCNCTIYKLEFPDINNLNEYKIFDLKLLKREIQQEITDVRILKNGIKKQTENIIKTQYWGIIFLKYEYMHWNWLHMVISDGVNKSYYNAVELESSYRLYTLDTYNSAAVYLKTIYKSEIQIINTKFFQLEAIPGISKFHYSSPTAEVDCNLIEISPIAFFDHSRQYSQYDWFPWFDFTSWSEVLKSKYDFLLPGRKNVYKINVKFGMLYNLIMYNWIYINSQKYFLSNIDGFNLKRKTAELKVIEEGI